MKKCFFFNFKPSLEYDYVEKNNNQIILKIYNLSKYYQLALYLFLHFFIFLSILMVIISLELTRVNPDRNIFSINVELTSTFLLYRGLVHHHHRILNLIRIYLISELIWLLEQVVFERYRLNNTERVVSGLLQT